MNCSSLYRVFIENKGDCAGNEQGQNPSDCAENHSMHRIAFSANKADQRKERRRTAGRITPDCAESAEKSRNSRAGDRAYHRLSISHIDSIKGRFRNAGNRGGDAAGDSLRTGILVFCFQRHAKGRAALGNIRAEHGDRNDHVVTQSGKIVHRKRHQRVVHSGHNNERHQGGQDADRQPGRFVVQGGEHNRQQIAGDVADGPQHIKGAGDTDDDEQQGLEEGFQHIGGNFIRKILRPFHHRSHEQHGQNGGSIGRADHRDTKKIGARHTKEGSQFQRCAAHQIGKIRVAQCRAHHHKQRWVAAYFFAMVKPIKTGRNMKKQSAKE